MPSNAPTLSRFQPHYAAGRTMGAHDKPRYAAAVGNLFEYGWIDRSYKLDKRGKEEIIDVRHKVGVAPTLGEAFERMREAGGEA